MKTVTSVTSKNTQYEIGDEVARREKLNIVDLPKNVSAFANDVGFIDKTVSNLLNYYTKSEVYTKSEINERLSAKWDSKFVDELPTEDISTSTIYFVPRPKTEQEQDDVYNEYIYSGTWELIGNTYTDLSNYYTKSEAESMAEDKVSVEVQNRLTSESELNNSITEVQNNVNDVSNLLSSETSERERLNLIINQRIDDALSNLNSEIERATTSENQISDRCDDYDSHLIDTQNPHNVTSEQIGLGNVTNVSTTDTISKDSDENITSGAVYDAMNEKVDKIDGKGLSDENFTYAEKTKLSGLSNYDDSSLKSRVSETESAITTLNGDSTVAGSVDKKISDALDGVTSISFEIVSELPTTGKVGVIYFVTGTQTSGENIYSEYVWVGNKFEKIGESSSTIDLNDYYKKTEVNALVSAKNDKINVAFSSSSLSDSDYALFANMLSIPESGYQNPTNLKVCTLSLLWNYINSKISTVGDCAKVSGISIEII